MMRLTDSAGSASDRSSESAHQAASCAVENARCTRKLMAFMAVIASPLLDTLRTY